MNKITLILALIIPLINSSCEKGDCHEKIAVKNDSDKTLYVNWALNYPDTLRIYNPRYEVGSKVNPNSKSSGALWKRSCFEYVLTNSYNPNILSIYIFDAEVLDNTPWDTVKTNYLVLKRYDLSLEELNELNWEITYP